MKKHYILTLLILIVLVFNLSSCKDDKDKKEKMNISYTLSTIMKDTVYETECFIVNSGIDGPKVAIIGGTHGDEVAGYTAATELKDELINGEYYFIGSILIIPVANSYAVSLNSRKPSNPLDPNNTNNSEYYNLNRNFPGNDNSSMTAKLAYEIVERIEEFNADAFIDLHESLHSHTESLSGDKYEWLGETLISGNYKSSEALTSILEDYNSKYSPSFSYKTNPEENSFNYYFSGMFYSENKDNLTNMGFSAEKITKMKSYTRKITYTIETTRTNVQLSIRVKEQRHMLDSILNYVYSLD